MPPHGVRHASRIVGQAANVVPRLVASPVPYPAFTAHHDSRPQSVPRFLLPQVVETVHLTECPALPNFDPAMVAIHLADIIMGHAVPVCFLHPRKQLFQSLLSFLLQSLLGSILTIREEFGWRGYAAAMNLCASFLLDDPHRFVLSKADWGQVAARNTSRLSVCEMLP